MSSRLPTSRATRSARRQPPAPPAPSAPPSPPTAPIHNAGPFLALVNHVSLIVQDGSDKSNSNPKEKTKPSERPAKRPRTDSDADDSYIPVSRRSIVVTKPVLGNRFAAEQATLRNANRDFIFLYREKEGLAITTRDRRRIGGDAKVTIPPDELGPLDVEDVFILKAANKIGPDPPDPGLLWTSVCLKVHVSEGQASLAIDLELRWNTSSFVGGYLHVESQRELRRRMLAMFFPDVPQDRLSGAQKYGSPQDFYEAANVPPKDGSDEDDPLHVPELTARLFPFQRRATRWLLNREGVQWTSDCGDGESGVIPYEPFSDQQATSHFVRATDVDGEPCFISNLFGVVTRHPAVFEANERTIRGGILSEEMGLGKTVEMISLILLHRRPPVPPLSPAAASAGNASSPTTQLPRPIGATLIVTPPALRSQWMSELNRHAPDLKVMVYGGMKKSCPDDSSEAAMVEELAVHDVVITTYSDLRSELHFAVEPPERDLRGARKRSRPRSPLVQLSWWRVCLDEAQEIESGVSNAATVVRVVPRVNAWGVTGTPVKDDIQDLWGLLVFLRYEPYASIPKVWQDLTRSHKAVFRNLFSRISMRNTKRVVGDELSIPPQKRYVITMPFTAVEEQHYQSLFKQLAEACGLDARGAPLRPDWDPDDSAVQEAMRAALNRLRQTALHPEIGDQNRRALGHRAGPMRTLAEVLDAMIELSESSLLVDRRALLAHKLKRGQMLENSPRVREALEIWQGVLKESEAMVQSAREKFKSEVERAKEAGGEEAGEKRRPGKYDDDSESDEDDADGQDKAAGGRVGDAQRELRYGLEIQHRAEFFCANAYFQIKSNAEMTAPGSDEFLRLEKLETEGYERAKRVRQEILQENRGKATRKMAELSGKAATQSFAVIPECVFAERSGIEEYRTAEELQEFGGLLNDQANQIDSWREAVIQLLLRDLVDESDEVEITGDEYENSTRVQDEIQAYLTILRAAISDRHVALSGIAPSELAKYEEQAAIRLAKNGEGPAPELMMRLFKERKDVAPQLKGQPKRWSLRAAVVRLRESVGLRLHAGSGNHRAHIELACLQERLKNTQEQQTEQTKAITMLEKEASKVRSALNARIAFYRQLQIVSDMVAPYEGVRDAAAIAAAGRDEENLSNALATAESKHRYLIHLKETDAKDEQRLCVICQSTFVVGVLTVCGHQFCKDCMTAWFQAHHNCPMCKRGLSMANLHDIMLKPQELKVVSESAAEDDNVDNDGDGYSGSSSNSSSSSSSGSSSSSSSGRGDDGKQLGQQIGRMKKTGIYSNFSADQLDMELPGPSFTTKVDTLVRHLLWLRSSDPGTKSIVFSQFPEFLVILAQAFTRHHIGFSRFADRNGIAKFREDPSIECFLLHARAHSSGLNLVNANHVILCEPLVNTALELQAIARVHRIGQEHETTVWLYIVDGTVEESIYDLSVQRRMEHMGRNLRGKAAESTPELLDRNLELANSLELQQAQLSKLMSKGKMAGEEVAKADLWNCLFGSSARQSAAAAAAADVANGERLRNDVYVRRHLAASAAEERQQ